eukprot:CAMPEP_0194097046 /NCGR_PEP_ID=MMETSP0149-20130528/57660_1 /TAXON_ID=122233 /ORGANISM="Chaetoceros debilis, Strain MM31A-1" /LENGTH=669 /DNA_ID=CAMNT_0038783051 /DNA_START=107 /DNA_END=2116 /DNA_ORIENTATION=-
MGCIESKEEEDDDFNQGAMMAIGRSERISRKIDGSPSSSWGNNKPIPTSKSKTAKSKRSKKDDDSDSKAMAEAEAESSKSVRDRQNGINVTNTPAPQLEVGGLKLSEIIKRRIVGNIMSGVPVVSASASPSATTTSMSTNSMIVMDVGMGCIQSQEEEDDGFKQEAMMAIGRSERITRKVDGGPSSSWRNKPISKSKIAKSKRPKMDDSADSKANSEAEMSKSVRDRQNGINVTNSPAPQLDEDGRLKFSEILKRRIVGNEMSEVPVVSTTLTSTNSMIVMDVAACTQKGWYPDDPHKPNQDSYSIEYKFNGANMEDDSFLAIYDGHGPVGEHFANYAKKNLPKLIKKYVKQERVKKHKKRNDNLLEGEKKIPFNPKLWPNLEPSEYIRASTKAHMECNQNMIDTQPLVSLSGTTAISAAIHNGNLIISNVGDSRAILGVRDSSSPSPSSPSSPSSSSPSSESKGNSNIVAVPLSKDQTPWRKDERERVIKEGGRIMTIKQMMADGNTDEEGNVKVKTVHFVIMDQQDNMDGTFGDRTLGEGGDIDDEGDPPRVWLKNKNLPGVSFSRSLGDSIANRVGVNGEPETFAKAITDDDKIIVLASDGVFEFIPNQTIIDLCAESKNPAQACTKIVDMAYHQWLKYEDRTDDITIIVMFLRVGGCERASKQAN